MANPASPPRSIRSRRILALFLTLIALNVIYPISELGDIWQAVYIVPYVVQLGIGISLIEMTPFRRRLALFLAGLVLMSVLLWIATDSEPSVSLLFYISLVAYQVVLIFVLLRYIFVARHVQIDVILAAAAAYLLIADVYIPLYMTLDIVTRATTGNGAFVYDALTFMPVTWQQMTYYSFITLATLGYGDITPVTSPAQAASSSEAVIGVLYTTILIARLVSLSSVAPQRRNEDEPEEP
jgi:hypothetical protein